MTSSVHRKPHRSYFASHEDPSASESPPIPSLRCPSPSGASSNVQPHCRDEQNSRIVDSAHDLITQPDVLSDTTQSLNSVSLFRVSSSKEQLSDKSSITGHVKAAHSDRWSEFEQSRVSGTNHSRDKLSENEFSKANNQSFRWPICSEEEELEEESEPCSWNLEPSQNTLEGCFPPVPQSASYFQPRTLAGYIKYLEYVFGYSNTMHCSHCIPYTRMNDSVTYNVLLLLLLDLCTWKVVSRNKA